MKTKFIATLMASALLNAGLIPLGIAQSDFGRAQEGIEVITVVGKRPLPDGIEVITVVGKRPASTVASTCVSEVVTGKVTGEWNARDHVDVQALESRHVSRDSVRQAIKDCIEQAQSATVRS